MKTIQTVIAATLVLGFIVVVKSPLAQTPSQNQSVMLEAEVSENPAEIELSWLGDNKGGNWVIYRKKANDQAWGNQIGSNPANDTTFTDNNIATKKSYEYRVFKVRDDTVRGTGLIQSGISAKANHFRGRLALLVDSRFKQSLNNSINQFQKDLTGAGWRVHTNYIDTSENVEKVKDTIQQLHEEYPDQLNTVFLMGSVPVPYSGNFGSQTMFPAPDGHGNHGGAWPADMFYGELDGVWTDQYANNTSSNRSENHNISGDGKFDQSFLQQGNFPNQQVNSKVDLRVGRLDFSNLPAFDTSEEALFKRYFKKNHAFRHGETNITNRGIIENNFNRSEDFEQNGYRNFAPLLGRKNLDKADFKNGLVNESALWSYGAGAGSYKSASGILTSDDFASDTLSFQGVFSMIFGSYFGDWDSEDNLLRSALASKGNLLATAWAGRPLWHFHPMGLGASIGYCTKITQNNANIGTQDPLYPRGAFAGGIHVTLLGDPTLTMYNYESPQVLSHEVLRTAKRETVVRLQWETVPDADGYAIYRWDTGMDRYAKLNANMVKDTTYEDGNVEMDKHAYMVRAMKLQNTPSGSYYNLSQGVFDTADNLTPSGSIASVNQHNNLRVAPNPTDGDMNVRLKSDKRSDESNLQVTTVEGQVLENRQIGAGQSHISLNLSELEAGVYFLKWQHEASVKTEKVVIK